MKRLRRMACRHEYGWAERRQADVCYHCGKVRSADDAEDGAAPAQLRSATDNER